MPWGVGTGALSFRGRKVGRNRSDRASAHTPHPLGDSHGPSVTPTDPQRHPRPLSTAFLPRTEHPDPKRPQRTRPPARAAARSPSGAAHTDRHTDTTQTRTHRHTDLCARVAMCVRTARHGQAPESAHPRLAMPCS